MKFIYFIFGFCHKKLYEQKKDQIAKIVRERDLMWSVRICCDFPIDWWCCVCLSKQLRHMHKRKRERTGKKRPVKHTRRRMSLQLHTQTASKRTERLVERDGFRRIRYGMRQRDYHLLPPKKNRFCTIEFEILMVNSWILYLKNQTWNNFSFKYFFLFFFLMKKRSGE